MEALESVDDLLLDIAHHGDFLQFPAESEEFASQIMGVDVLHLARQNFVADDQKGGCWRFRLHC